MTLTHEPAAIVRDGQNSFVDDEPISAIDLSRRLGRPAPTTQQIAVIEAPLRPAMVVAGAGSGKTETMANRVLWLLANRHVLPQQVLGLTFTRKAAAELDERMSSRIRDMRERGLLARDESDDFVDAPTISTYNAFANALLRDHGILVGLDEDVVLLGESSAWALARATVIEHGDTRLASCERSIDSLAGAVLALSRDMAENGVGVSQLHRLSTDFAGLADLPYDESGRKNTPYASVIKACDNVSILPVLAELAEKYRQAKRQRGLIDYTDQLAYAHAIVESVPQVAAEYRDRFSVVLLDEYQDTSVLQTLFLGALFRGSPVMAVGDPHQSIYGWRGASANNMASFSRDFSEGNDVPTLQLTTSWRNNVAILNAANDVVQPLRDLSPVTVSALAARPGAAAGVVSAVVGETIDDETRVVTSHIRTLFNEHALSGTPPSIALLFRTRAHMESFAGALAAAGVAHHVVGLGGLLSAPEVLDVLCMLRVLHDPHEGSALIRLLVGGRWRIGVSDLAALSRLASWLRSRGNTEHVPPHTPGAPSSSFGDDGARSIVDALDFLVQLPGDHAQCGAFSGEGIERLKDAGTVLARLRSRSHMGLLELVHVIEAELRLDIELRANERRREPWNGNLNAFHDEVAAFLASNDAPTLARFVRWLDRAQKHDDLAPSSTAPEPGVVQLLTVHAAKGLEWDHVVIPRCLDDEFPCAAREGDGWLRFGAFPAELGHDAAFLPQLAWRHARTQQEFDAALKEYRSALEHRSDLEERRLMYVAITRARESVMLTASFWARGTQVRRLSPFLTELETAGLIDELPAASAHAENPLFGNENATSWPRDPLGTRRVLVESAAQCVRDVPAGTPGSYAREIELLLAEHDERDRAHSLPLPSRVAASRLKDFIGNPTAAAHALFRPMPKRPIEGARLGTRFHSWVEQRSSLSSTPRLGPSHNDDGGYSDDAEWLVRDDGDDHGPDTVDGNPSGELETLQRAFEASEWASQRPVYTELDIQMSLDDHIVVCKLDAVYARENGRYEIVDWKTGRAPRDERDTELWSLQLALYREAFAQWKNIPSNAIDVAFFFVRDGRILRPALMPTLEDLGALWKRLGE